MKRFLSALTATFVSGAIALAANIPLIPSNPTYSEPSQIIGTLNALIQQLNGGVGFAPAQVVSFGSFCTNAAAGGTPQICNGQRGQVAFTGITVAATGTSQTLVITDSSITAGMSCYGQWSTAFTANSALYVATMVPTAGSLSVVTANGGATTNAVTTGTLSFNCM